jgi:4-amino-4-deoxy-L-arabinose transferase-like glycosyltransferase
MIASGHRFFARTPGRWLVTIVLIGALLRFLPIWFGLPDLRARPDEETAVGIAAAMQQGDLNPRFFHWPSLIFYVFAGLYAALSSVCRVLSSDCSFTVVEHVLIARAFVAFCGSLTILVLYGLARRMADSTTGLVAAGFLSVAILHVRDSHFAMTDVPMTLLVTTSLALLLRAIDTRSTPPNPPDGGLRWFALAGLTAGLATSTKYNAIALLGAMGGAQILWLARAPKGIRSARAWTPSVVFVTIFAMGFIAATPYALLDFQRFLHDVRFDFQHLSEGHAMNLGRGWVYHLQRSLPYGVGVPTFIAAACAIVPLLREYRKQAFVLAGFAVPFYAAIGSGSTVFFRYIMPLVPIVCLLAAVAVRHGAGWLARRAGLPPTAVVASLSALIAAPALINCVWFDVLLAKTDTRVLAARWLAPRLQPEASLYDAGSGYTRLDLGHLPFREWSFDPDAFSFGHPEGHTPDWLVVSESPLRLYAAIPPQLRVLIQEKYELAYHVPGTKGRSRAAVYDLQDAFFMPVSRFDTIERPGPTIWIYRRTDRPAAPPPRG